MGRIKYLILLKVTSILVLLANVTAASACLWVHYQPDMPEKLAKY
ncbi:MAG: cyclic lactone autoinducer peptide [Peptococcaceae bacterium]|nr:cyclic lactone autoinducer peptide [Peptococcaceae bacterium]